MNSVLYLTKNKVFVSHQGKSASVDRGGQDLTAIFKTIKQKIKITQANIVLGNDLSYTLALSQTNLENREQILKLSQQYIPEDLSNHNFDWQKKGEYIQVVATPTKVINNLSLAAKINKIKLNSIQTATVVLTQSTAPIKYPHLILHQDQEGLVVASFKGVVFFAHNQPNLEIDSLVNIASIIKQKYDLDIKGVVVSGVHIDKSIDVPAQWEAVKKNINIMATATKKKKTSTKDKDELEIKPVENPTEEPKTEPETTPEPVVEPQPAAQPVAQEPVVDATSAPAPTPEISFDQEPETKQKPTGKSNKGLFVSLAITLVVGGALTGGILYSRSATNNQDIRSKAAEDSSSDSGPAGASSDVESVTETPTPTPEQIDFTDYALQIQNGSGTAGQAGAVDEILQAEGFAEADTVNADSYDYQDTEVQLKEGTPKAVFNAIERALNSDYQVTTGETLDKDSDFDVVVIVGQKI